MMSRSGKFLCTKRWCSLQKVVCATPHGEATRLHFISFKGKILDNALKYIQDKCGDHLEEGSTVFVTGYNADQNKILMEEKLGICIKIFFEFVCVVEGFQFLAKHLSASELVFPKPIEVERHCEEFVYSFNHLIVLSNEKKWLELAPVGQRCEGGTQHLEKVQGMMELNYPIMVVISGSAFMYCIVQEDGTFGNVNVMNPIGGRTLMGLSSLILGTKTFGELEDLASQGCSSPLHNITGQGEMDIPAGGYKVAPSQKFLTFLFGEAIGKNVSDFRKEDIARSLLSLVAWQAAYSTLLACSTYNVRQVFFCGGLTSGSETFREDLSKYMAELRTKLTQDLPFYIVKLGGHASALYGLIKHLEAHQK